MTNTTFTAGTVIASTWLNDVNSVVYNLFPSLTVGSTGQVLRSNGTNYVASTSTFADTYGASTLLYSNGTNTVTGLATANSSGLLTNNSGVPAWVTVTGTGAPVLATSPQLVTPKLGTVNSGDISACTSTSMVMVTPVLGTPTSGTLTNCTGLPATSVTGTTATTTFTITLTGCTAGVTGTAVYSITNNVVTLFIPALIGTSNSTAATLTGLPAAITPVTSHLGLTAISRDNGTDAISRIDVTSGGVVTLYVGVSATFTNTGTKGLTAGATLIWNLN